MKFLDKTKPGDSKTTISPRTDGKKDDEFKSPLLGELEVRR